MYEHAYIARIINTVIPAIIAIPCHPKVDMTVLTDAVVFDSSTGVAAISSFDGITEFTADIDDTVS
jgi:hypothetical protein